MGVKGLNSLITQWCRKQIKPTNINALFGKKIAIDTSIYMYEFKGRKSLLRDFNDMIVMFRNNNITPIFVFDGKAPVEKNETLIVRRENKKRSEDEYKLLLDELVALDGLQEPSLSLETDRRKIMSRLTLLEDKFVRINRDDIYNVKQLMDLYGVTYYEHDGEAEQLCSKLVIDGSVYACMSDDMDLFIYGCPRILKRLDLYRNTVDYYDLEVILKILNVTLLEFKYICVLSGTDYNKKGGTPISIKNAFKLFSAYQYEVKCRKAAPNSFYYYISNTVRNVNINYKDLFGIVEMFELSDVKIPNNLNCRSSSSVKNIGNADDDSRKKLLHLLTL
jgi:flap endonuclease-1